MSLDVKLAELIAASSGTFVITTDTAKVVDAIGIYAASDTVFNEILRDDAADADVKAEYIDDSGEGTVPAGVLITPNLKAGRYFTSIDLTSGTVVAILR